MSEADESRPLSLRVELRCIMPAPVEVLRRSVCALGRSRAMLTTTMRAALGVGLFLALGVVSCRVPPDDIYCGSNIMYFDGDGRIFIAQGRWQRVGEKRTVLVPDVNSARIECYRDQGFCDEYIAKFITPADDETKTSRGESLFLMKETFRITEWNDHTIMANAGPRAADLHLRISLRDGVAERSARWTPARGAEVDDPTVVYHWVFRTVKPPDPAG